jgi:3-keto-5-aminohexanoate cleavage enzyme
VDPLIITAAAVGAEVTKEQQPALPVSPQELAADAAACREAGASIYHLHVRDDSGEPTMDVDRFAECLRAIRAATDLIVQFTSGGAVSDTEESRLAPLELRPEMATLTTGTVNFGDEVFYNPAPLVERFYRRMRQLGVLPEFEIFDSGMLASAERLLKKHGDGHHLHFDFVLGVPGGMPAWPDAVEFLARHLPAGATFSATGIGRAHLDVTHAAIGLGGHVRTGLEDVRYYDPGRPARSNAELIARVADLGRSAGRAIATPEVARRLLGLAPPA